MRAYSRAIAIPAVVLALVLALSPGVDAISITFVDPGDANTTEGHPARAWTQTEKDIVNFALAEWNELCASKVAGSWTLRWEDNDLFKNWGTGLDFSDAVGLTVYPGWKWSDHGGTAADDTNLPGSELYFNTGVAWFFDTTVGQDEEFDPQNGNDWQLTAKDGSAAEGVWDFLSVVKHELGHALGLGHLTGGKDGVMDSWGIGERRHTSPADKEAFYAANPQCIPEPATLLLVCLGFAALTGLRRQR